MTDPRHLNALATAGNRRARSTRALATTLAVALIPLGAASAAAAGSAAPAAKSTTKSPAVDIGKPGLPEKRSVTKLAPGVSVTTIVRGGAPARAGAINTTPYGPWRIRVATIEPGRAKGQLRTAIGYDLAHSETVSTLGTWSRSLVAMNGSFFAFTRSKAYPGDPLGLAVNGGTIVSEPMRVAGHVGLLMDSTSKKLRMGSYTWTATLTGSTPGNTREVLAVGAVNSPPVVPADCTLPGSAGCTSRGSVIRFTPHWAKTTPAGVGSEVVLGKDGCVVRATPRRGTALTPAQTSIQATGTSAARLLELAGSGCPAFSETLRDGSGKAVKLTPTTFGVTGRYRLLADGKNVAPSGSSAFLRRHPRSIMGSTADGTVMMVTIDGRSTLSVGATLVEAASVARSLGMTNAVNLDGGGSTAMAVRGKVLNRLSEGRERAVGDAVVFMP
ncbi:phosphodiester glycosidase family protein [Gephyromycinifex aptenodytis]|uniref:phosphodiester glycosidase family protein n=1 Tax=Gephyromycinifex aptenodytis TaxID=2716227 RepID=UPI0014463558|nr:phosphodiester glycosidase family protein [Gephyromycinifex aptenodytis]